MTCSSTKLKVVALSVILLLPLVAPPAITHSSRTEQPSGSVSQIIDDMRADSTATSNSPPPLTGEAQGMPGEQLFWHVISSGATESEVGEYHLTGTVSQTAVGRGVSEDNCLGHGYWQIFSADTSCCGRYTGGYTGNVDCDPEGKINLADITRLIDRIYLSKKPLCCEDNGDVNADCKLNLADITLLIDHIYLSKSPLALCSTVAANCHPSIHQR